MSKMVATYMDMLRRGLAVESKEAADSTKISWDMTLRSRYKRGLAVSTSRADIRVVSYRPFTLHSMVVTPHLLYSMTTIPSTFPTPSTPNQAIVVTGKSSHHQFSAIAVKFMPDVHTLDSGQFFPRWRYEKVDNEEMLDLSVRADGVFDGFRRIHNISDTALKRFVAVYGPKMTKDDIFFYVYGLLHSAEYREIYATDLKKMLPRIPLVADPWRFVQAGRALSELHMDYESVARYPLDGLNTACEGDPYEFFRVEKIAFARIRRDGRLVTNRSKIKYNSRVTLGGIPEEAYRYTLGSRSAIEWIMDRYQMKTDKESGITNDPNDWSREVRDPRYIVDLLARIVTVSIETMRLVDDLPSLEIISTP